MTVETITVGLVKTNCYLVYDEESGNGFIVDPGDNARRILSAVSDIGINIQYIILTHSHFDHILAVSEVAAATGAKVAIHELEAENVSAPKGAVMTALGFPPITIKPSAVDLFLKDGDVIKCAGASLTVIHTPGHTVGSICIDTGELLFSGDTLFEDDCGRCDLPGGDYSVMMKSLRRLAMLEGDRVVYPGHDVSTTL